MNLEWWHWLVLGFVLIIAELALPAFFVIWFGLAALAVGVMVAIVPGAAISIQILSWALLSLALLGIWMRFFRNSDASTNVGQADSAIGEVGMVVSPVGPYQPGKVRFQRPLLGSDLWECVCDGPLTVGTRVKVTAIEGSAVRVSAA